MNIVNRSIYVKHYTFVGTFLASVFVLLCLIGAYLPLAEAGGGPSPYLRIVVYDNDRNDGGGDGGTSDGIRIFNGEDGSLMDMWDTDRQKLKDVTTARMKYGNREYDHIVVFNAIDGGDDDLRIYDNQDHSLYKNYRDLNGFRRIDAGDLINEDGYDEICILRKDTGYSGSASGYVITVYLDQASGELINTKPITIEGTMIDIAIDDLDDDGIENEVVLLEDRGGADYVHILEWIGGIDGNFEILDQDLRLFHDVERIDTGSIDSDTRREIVGYDQDGAVTIFAWMWDGNILDKRFEKETGLSDCQDISAGDVDGYCYYHEIVLLEAREYDSDIHVYSPSSDERILEISTSYGELNGIECGIIWEEDTGG